MAREARREFRWQRRAGVRASPAVGQSRSRARSAFGGPELRTLADARAYMGAKLVLR
jgi:hypothetical protein